MKKNQNSLAQQKDFGAAVLHSMLRLARGMAKHNKSAINTI
jgi:hypothetical protein